MVKTPAKLQGLTIWTDKYLSDTQHLSTAEHGAYFLLLLAMWRAGGTLPDDDQVLRRITRMRPIDWRRSMPTIRPFFTKTDGGKITQKRLALELQRVLTAISASQTRSDLGVKAKALKNKERLSSQVNLGFNRNVTSGKRTLDSGLEGRDTSLSPSNPLSTESGRTNGSALDASPSPPPTGTQEHEKYLRAQDALDLLHEAQGDYSLEISKTKGLDAMSEHSAKIRKELLAIAGKTGETFGQIEKRLRSEADKLAH